jgi:threonine/homoserine/homoserine lactone efflux protein
MNYLSIFVISFIIAFSGALMPGPLLTAVIAESAKSGAKSGPFISLGHAILEALMVGFIIFGFAHFIHNPGVITAISIVGSLILLYFGISMLLSVPGLSTDSKNNYKKSSGLILLGITASITNPYWTLWWLTIGLGLVLGAQKGGWLAIGLFFLGHILADFGWYSLVSLAISKGSKFISLKIYKAIIIACGLSLIGFSIYFLIRSFKPLF